MQRYELWSFGDDEPLSYLMSDDDLDVAMLHAERITHYTPSGVRVLVMEEGIPVLYSRQQATQPGLWYTEVFEDD